jgi:hypothetical protein
MTGRDEIAEFARLFTGFLEQRQELPTPGRESLGDRLQAPDTGGTPPL